MSEGDGSCLMLSFNHISQSAFISQATRWLSGRKHFSVAVHIKRSLSVSKLMTTVNSYYCPMLHRTTSSWESSHSGAVTEASLSAITSSSDTSHISAFPLSFILVLPQLSLNRVPMCTLVRKSQVGMLLTAWWMFMAVISLGALQSPKLPS